MIFLAMLIAGLGSGCGRGGENASSEARAADDTVPVAASDSSAHAAASDSAAQVAAPDSTSRASKGGFLSGLFGRKGDEEDEEEEAVPVELALVEVRDMPAYLETTATLEPEKRAEILAKIDGEIREIRAEEGDWVREGQILAILDGAVQRVTLEEAQARFHARKSDLQRAQGLFEQKLASEKQLHDTQFQFEEAEAQCKGAQLQVDYTRVLAPFSGQIAERLVDPGQTVAPGARIFSVVDRDPLLVRIHLPEREAMKIVSGQEIVVSPGTDPSLRVPGQVLRVAPVVDSRTGTVKVTCQVSGRTQGFRPGSFVRVRVRTDFRHGVLVIPKRALVPEGGEVYVFKAEADSVVKVPVATGLTNHLLVEVTEGLREGERVVTVGQGALRTGSRIREIRSDQSCVADSAPGGSITP